MANTSILSAFERMWQHTNRKLETKADAEYVEAIKSKVGDISVSEQITEAIDSHNHSWNDLTDRPFYDSNIAINWDGNIDGKDAFVLTLSEGASYNYYKLSDHVPNINDLVGGIVTFYGETLTLTSDFLIQDVGCYYLGEPAFVVIQNAEASMDGIAITPPSTGIYFMNMDGAYVSNLTYGSIKTLDEKYISENIARVDDIVENTVSYAEPQTLTPEQQAQARTNINAVSMEEVEELMGIEEEFSVTGELVEFDLDVEEGTELEVISKIHRDETWGESNKLVLHQVSGTNFVDLSGFLGGAGTVFETNGLTATVNDNSTVTIRGTNESTGWSYPVKKTIWSGEHSARVYPAGTYTIPDFTIRVRAAQYPNNTAITGVSENLSGTVTIPEPFRIVMIQKSVRAGATVDMTLPLGLFRGDSIPETGYEYQGQLHTVTFDTPVYDGEYNWTTGELKDTDGNTVAYYEPQPISRLSGVNYFWTCFGENVVSNKSNNDLEKVVIRLGEAAPEETVASICDFTITPTTTHAVYCLHDAKVRNGGVFHGHEIPLVTTKGTISVVNSDGEVTTEKYVDNLINWQGVSDTLTNEGVHKAWSNRFYITKEPVLQEDFADINNALYTFEFTDEDFQNVGIPAKLDNIPIVSPCFYTEEDATSKLNERVWGGGQFPATLSWDGVSEKYIFKVRGLYPGNIMPQLTSYTKCYFYYQLETPYDELATFAMGISSGDTVTFTADDSEWKPYLDGGLYDDFDADVTPTGFIYIPRNAVDACDGMINAARMLNNAGSSGSDATVQGYSWIGEGDGSTDYTSKIQSKLDALHSVSNGGTIYLGPGTYKISGSLIVYGNTRIIGDGQTIIEQTADNTHALVLCGSSITIEDLSIKLSGQCTTIAACVYVNSMNKPSVDGYNSAFPETSHVKGLTVDNVFMSGEYKFGSSNGYPIVSDAYENYMGVGIYNNRGYFTYAHVDNVHFNYLHAGVYGGGGSNYFNVTSEFCKYGLYIFDAGDNTYFVNGHSYYAINEDGNHITMSDAIAYVLVDTFSTYHLRSYDNQAYNKLVFLGEKTSNNKIDYQSTMATGASLSSSHNWNILKYLIVDYGRGNQYDYGFKYTPYHIGTETVTISRGPQFEQPNPVIQNALSGAGIWGNISSNTEFENFGISLRDVCRYPSEKTVVSKRLPYILSTIQPTENNPIEIVIDLSNRPVIGGRNYFIQFHHNYVASDYAVSFDTTNTGEYGNEIVVTDNTNITEFFYYPQASDLCTIYRMKFRFTKPLQIANLQNAMFDEFFDYNPDGLIGICNIGMTVNDYAGRSFLGECGGSLYGNVDMHNNTLKNLPAPVDDGDAVSKAYVDERISQTAKVQIITWEDDD